MARNRLLRWSVAAVVIALVTWFFARTIRANWAALEGLDLSLDAWGVTALVLFVVAVVSSGVLWGRMLDTLSGGSTPVLEAIRVHCASWLLKYVPGQAGSVANKVVWASGRGVSRVLVVLTFVYENAFLLLASIVPTAIVLVSYGSLDLADSRTVPTLLVPLLALVPLALVTVRPLFAWLVNLLGRRVLKRAVPPEAFLTPRQALLYQVGYVGPRLITGAGFVCIAISLFDVAPSTWVPLACAYILAGAAGILAIFVPSGLGVRESVCVLLATPFLPVEQAVLLALVARLFSTASDVLVAACYGALTSLRPRRKSRT